MTIQSQSRAALHELIELLQEVDQHWCSEERNLASAEDIAGSHRALMHILEAGLVGYFEQELNVNVADMSSTNKFLCIMYSVLILIIYYEVFNY